MSKGTAIKFLNSYTKDDKEIFFGREKETIDLYQKINQSRIVLLYGMSGTGKTSLIQCGLENKFEAGQRLFLYIRKGRNILNSFSKSIASETDSLINPKSKPLDALEVLYYDFLKPITLVFDQFEELFISGSIEEINDFIGEVVEILNSGLKVKFIFSLREEYLAYLDLFEEKIPIFFDFRMRVEKMRRNTLSEVISNIAKKSEIGIESQEVPELIIDNISDRKGKVELPYLQVYLHKLTTLDAFEKGNKEFSMALVNEAGQLDDVLGDFLDEQISKISSKVGNKDGIEGILKEMITADGTKKQLSKEDIHLPEGMDENSLDKVLAELEASRLVKFDDGIYELSHDSLAKKVAEKRSTDELQLIELIKFIKNAYNDYRQTQTLLNRKQLNFIDPFFEKLKLEKHERDFITESREEADRIDRKAAIRRRNGIIAAACFILALIIFGGFMIYQYDQANTAKQEAVENLIEAEKQKTIAAKERDRAQEKEKQAKDALVEAKKQKDIAVAQTDTANMQRANALRQESIAKQKQAEALEQKKIADRQKKKAIEKEKEAITQRDRAENIIDAFYFYDDRLALAYKNAKYGYINKDGESVIDYKYDHARPFNYPGLAQVKKGNGNFLIDSEQKEEYILEERSISNSEAEAFDGSNKQLIAFPVFTGNNSQLKYIVLKGNEIREVPKEIEKHKELNALILFDNEISSVSSSINTLESLRILDLSKNELDNLPPIGGLSGLQELILYDNNFTSLPEGIDSLYQLKILDAGDNLINKVKPNFEKLGKLELLILGNNQFTEFPMEVIHLKNLQKLDLSGNKIKSIPKEIGGLNKLTHLHLWNNKLTVLNPQIAKLDSLKQLVLGHNELSVLPAKVYSLEKISLFDISNNKFTSLTDDIGNLKNLKSLYANGNDIESVSNSIGKLTKLQRLYLNNNELTELPDGLASIVTLRELYLEYNQLNILKDTLTTMEKLQRLNVSDNQLVSLPPSLNKMTGLTDLFASNNKIGQLPSAMEEMKLLSYLYLDNNQLTSLPSDFKNLPKLNHLVLNNNNLSDISNVDFRGFTNLTTLDLSNNNITVLTENIFELPKILNLDLSDNNIKEMPIEIDELASLKVLKLDRNTGIDLPGTIGELENLEELYLNELSLKELVIGLPNVQSLRTLDVGNNNFDSIPADIFKIRGLVVLDISGVAKGNLPINIAGLENLKQLKEIRMLGSEFNIDDKNKLKAVLPEKCRIIYN